MSQRRVTRAGRVRAAGSGKTTNAERAGGQSGAERRAADGGAPDSVTGARAGATLSLEA